MASSLEFVGLGSIGLVALILETADSANVAFGDLQIVSFWIDGIWIGGIWIGSIRIGDIQIGGILIGCLWIGGF